MQSLLPARLYALRSENAGLPQRSSRFAHTHGTSFDPPASPTNWKRYNTPQPPVAALPPEILSLIFRICAETERPMSPYNLSARALFESRLAFGIAVPRDVDAEEDLDEDALGEFEEPLWVKGRKGTLGYIELSHVCSKWRNVMLGYSALWAEDIGALPDALPTFLERAGGVLPLTVRVYGATYRRDNTPVWEALLASDGALARRVKALYWVETREAYLRRRLSARLRHCNFDTLERLIIWAHEYPEYQTGPQHLILTTPRLRVADFTNMALTPTSTSLTELSIRATCATDEGEYDAWSIEHNHLRSILEAHSQTLVHLYIDVESDFVATAPSLEPQLAFPHLQRLYLHDHSLGGDLPAPILSGISYPSSALTYLHLEQGSWEGDTSELIYLVGMLRQAGVPAPYGLAIAEERRVEEDVDDISLLIRFYVEPSFDISSCTHLANGGLFGHGTHRLTLRLEYDEHVPLRKLLEVLSQAIATDNVRTLSLTSSGICPGCREQTSSVIQEHFAGVRTVHVGDPHIGGVIPALGWLGNASMMPGLERLWLTRSGDADAKGVNTLLRRTLGTQLCSRYDRRPHGSRAELGAPARLKELRVCKSVLVKNMEYFAAQSMVMIRDSVDVLDWCTDFLPIH
ncbi:unnamed protein product [Peniophora sp. CBMAI 1063]|nr:unnamed protein product [Peniophora sp. CBMAI 1063]